MLPERYDTLTRVSLPFVFVLAAAQLLFFWNVYATLRGKAGAAAFDERGIPIAATRPRFRWGTASAEAGAVLAALFLVGVGVATGYVIGRETAESPAGSVTATTPIGTVTTEGVADAAAGEQVFADAGCGSCHTLAESGSTGTVGPSLDARPVSAALVVNRVTNGSGAMPSFEDRLSDEQIRDVAAYVADASGPG